MTRKLNLLGGWQTLLENYLVRTQLKPWIGFMKKHGPCTVHTTPHCGCHMLFSSVQSLSHVRLFATPWITACQASLSITNSRSSHRLMSMESVMHPAISSSVVPFSSCPQSLPALESFPMSQLFESGSQSTGVSANIQDWFPWGLTGLISLHSKGFSRVFSNTTVQEHQFSLCSAFLMVQLSHPYKTTGITIALTRQTSVGKVMSLLLNTLSRLVITFLPRSKRLLISWLQSRS